MEPGSITKTNSTILPWLGISSLPILQAFIWIEKQTLPLIGRVEAKVDDKNRSIIPSDLMDYVESCRTILDLKGLPIYTFQSGEKEWEIIMKITFSTHTIWWTAGTHNRINIWTMGANFRNKIIVISKETNHPLEFTLREKNNNTVSDNDFIPAGILSEITISTLLLSDHISSLFPLEKFFDWKDHKWLSIETSKNRVTLPSEFLHGMNTLLQSLSIGDSKYQLFLSRGEDWQILMETSLYYNNINSQDHYLVSIHNGKFCIPSDLIEHLLSTNILIERNSRTLFWFIIKNATT